MDRPRVPARPDEDEVKLEPLAGWSLWLALSPTPLAGDHPAGPRGSGRAGTGSGPPSTVHLETNVDLRRTDDTGDRRHHRAAWIQPQRYWYCGPPPPSGVTQLMIW